MNLLPSPFMCRPNSLSCGYWIEIFSSLLAITQEPGSAPRACLCPFYDLGKVLEACLQ